MGPPPPRAAAPQEGARPPAIQRVEQERKRQEHGCRCQRGRIWGGVTQESDVEEATPHPGILAPEKEDKQQGVGRGFLALRKQADEKAAEGKNQKHDIDEAGRSEGCDRRSPGRASTERDREMIG